MAAVTVSDQEISEALDTLFRETNPLSFTSLNHVVIRLQSRLRCLDLSHRLDFIRAHIALFFSIPTHHVPPPPPAHVTEVQRGCDEDGFVIPRHVREISFARPNLDDDGNGGGGNVGQVKESAQSKPKRKGGAGGLTKLCNVSPELEAVVGSPALPRTEIVKQLWAYIKKNNLQDPSNKRKIICNEELQLVFETDSTDMFKMNKLLSKHISPCIPPKESDSGQQSKKVKSEDPVVISEAFPSYSP
ncbi:Upstream activation factor subunit UAF30-like protein [Drosera capensis]